MKKILLPGVAAFAAASIALASPADDVKAAAKKLADASNYSWSTSTQNAGGGGGGGGFVGGPMSAVTEKGGYTVTTRETPNGTSQTVRKGEQFVMQNQDGEWVTQQELFAQFGGGQGGQGQKQGQGGQGGRGGRGGFGFGGGSPADDIVALVDGAKDLKVADGIIMGTLNTEAVTQRLGRSGFGRGGGGGGGQPPAPPTNASGSVKFWLKDGAITKYELNVKGTVQGRNGEVQVDRTTTTEIKNVGSTKVTVPEGAKKKLGA